MDLVGNIHSSLSEQDLKPLVQAIAAGGKLERGTDGKLTVVAAAGLAQVPEYDASIATDLDAIVLRAESLGLNTTHTKQLNTIKELRNQILHTQPADHLDWSLTEVRYDRMPADVLKLVFKKLELKDLLSCVKSNRPWNVLASEVLFDRCKERFGDSIFDKAAWRTYGYDVGPLPRPPNDLLIELLTCKDPKHPPLLYWMPTEVRKVPEPEDKEPKPLERWNLGTLQAKANASGERTPSSIYINGDLMKEVGDQTVPVAGWRLLHTVLIDRSLGQPRTAHEAQVTAAGARLPEPVEAATAVHMCKVLKGEDLYSAAGRPLGNYIRCARKEGSKLNPVFGGCGPPMGFMAHDYSVGDGQRIGAARFR